MIFGCSTGKKEFFNTHRLIDASAVRTSHCGRLPTKQEEYGDGGGDGPPQREQEIGQEADDREDCPEYFFPHWQCLGEHFPRGGAILRKSRKREVVSGMGSKSAYF